MDISEGLALGRCLSWNIEQNVAWLDGCSSQGCSQARPVDASSLVVVVGLSGLTQPEQQERG